MIYLSILFKELKDDLSINTFFKSKTIENVEKMSLFEKAVSNSMNAILVEVLKVVIENDDISLLKDVAKHFILLSKQKLNVAFVKVVSSNEMNSEQKDNISNSLCELIKKKIDISFDVDKNLIGGLKIKVDDTLYDSSLQTKLENAKSKLVGV